MSAQLYRDFVHGEQEVLELSESKFTDVELKVESPLQVQRQLSQADSLRVLAAQFDDALLGLVDPLLDLRFVLVLPLPLRTSPNAFLLLDFSGSHQERPVIS